MSSVRERNELDFARLESLAHELWALGTRFIALFGGEPLAYSRIGELLRLLAETGFRIGVVTNGYLLRGEVGEVLLAVQHSIGWVRISMDAGTELTHTKLHRPPRSCFDLILAQASHLAREGVKVGFSYVVSEINAAEITKCARLSYDAGATSLQLKPYVDPVTKHVVALSAETATTVRRQIEEASRLDAKSFQVQVVATLEHALNRHADLFGEEVKSYTFCPVSLFRMVIRPPGRIVCCPYFRGSVHHTIGALDKPLDGDWARRRLDTLRRINPRWHCRFPCNRHLLNQALHDWRLRYQRGEDMLAGLPVVKHTNPYWV